MHSNCISKNIRTAENKYIERTKLPNKTCSANVFYNGLQMKQFRAVPILKLATKM